MFFLCGLMLFQAVMLKRLKQGSETAETSSSSTSDSNTFYEDDFSATEDSSEEGQLSYFLFVWMFSQEKMVNQVL